MAKGWELSLGVQENFVGFGSTAGITSRPHRFLYADSETLRRNAVIKERDAKLIPTRLSPVQTASLEQYSPGGEITFQPRTDDCVSLLFAFFQAGTFMGGGAATTAGGTGGTWVFTPVGKSLTWSGVDFGTNAVYNVNVAKYYGAGLSGTGDGIRYERGIVTKLTIDQAPADDLKMTADLRFFQHTDAVVFGTGFKSQPNSTGSFSTKGQLVDWNGTLSVGGVGTFAIERVRFEFDNQTAERRKLGQKGFYNFPFGRAILMGEFDIELENLSDFQQGTAGGTLSARWQTSAGDWMEVFCPNIFYKANDENASDAGFITKTVPFRCYPTAFGGSNAAVVSVYPKYGTAGPPSSTQLIFG